MKGKHIKIFFFFLQLVDIQCFARGDINRFIDMGMRKPLKLKHEVNMQVNYCTEHCIFKLLEGLRAHKVGERCNRIF